jgi:tetratricopeptide (TPR) repeat protein
VIPIALLLGVLTCVLFLPLRNCAFLNYDDVVYVTGNPYVKGGISWASCREAMTACYGCNWHPLTTVSHMLDYEFYGLKPAGHHLTSVVLHALNTVLLFWLLRAMTGAIWRSAVVAALFAWHPLHVESVAWVAERKDLLSTFFGFLCLLAYTGYCKYRRAAPRTVTSEARGSQPVRSKQAAATRLRWRFFYFLALSFYAAGLLSKPMLVTLPFVMLLLDVWPLGRYRESAAGASVWNRARPLVLEKVPFLVLCALFCVITVWVQTRGGALESLDEIPFASRVANAAVSYAKYLGRTIVPVNLAILYPHPIKFPIMEVVGALLLLLLCAGIALWRARPQPYLMVGWFWFLGMLVPVIGLVQVGDQAMADRYTYVPIVGLFIAVVWALGDFVQRRAAWRMVVIGFGVVVLGAMCGATRAQLRHWKDSETVFRHALEVTRDNVWGEVNYACAMYEKRRFAEASDHFQRALRMKPAAGLILLNLGKLSEAMGENANALDYFAQATAVSPRNVDVCVAYGYSLAQAGREAEAAAQYVLGEELDPHNPLLQYNYGVLLSKQGRNDEAASHLREAFRLDPTMVAARLELGNLLARDGQIDSAIASFRGCIADEPTNATARVNLGILLEETGRSGEALQQYRDAVRVQPLSARARSSLGILLAKEGKPAEAELHFRRFTELEPTNANAFYNLGNVLFSQKKFPDAESTYSNALFLSPRDVQAGYKMAVCLAQQKKFAAAVGALRHTLELNPSHAAAMTDLAWLLAASAEPGLRNGPDAERLARRACALTAFSDVNARGALDAALAENGKFPEAIEAVAKTRALAVENGKPEQIAAADKRAALYREEKPYRLP